MRQASVPLCRIVIQLRNYSGPVQLEHGRLLRLPPIDATALITQVKSQIRDYLRLPVGRQILLYDGVPLQNEGTVAGYGLHRLPPPVLLQLAFEEPEPEPELEAVPNLSSRQGGGGGTSMLATLAQAYQENEPLARARLTRARTGVEFTNPDTGHSKLFSATQLPLPILIQKDERETRRLYATLVPQMSHAEALSACELAGLPVAQSTPLTALQSALTVHLNRQNGSSSSTPLSIVDAATNIVPDPATAPATAEGSKGQAGQGVVLKLNAYRMGDTQALAYADGLRNMARQGVEISEVHLNKNWLSEDGVAAISAGNFL